MMNVRNFLRAFAVSVVAWIAVGPLRAEAPPAELGKIEALIAKVEHLDGARFIRNGKDYDSKDAAKFLRGKWEAKAGQIATADEFIEKVGTVSSTSGKPYRIRMSDGREVNCGAWLKEELAKLPRS